MVVRLTHRVYNVLIRESGWLRVILLKQRLFVNTFVTRISLLLLFLQRIVGFFPNWVVAPSGSSFNSDAVEDGVDKGYEMVRVTKESHGSHTNNVVVDVNVVALRFKLLCHIHKEGQNSYANCNVVLQVANLVVEEGNIGKEYNEEEDHCEEQYPQVPWPVLHILPVQGELLEDSLVHMGELKSNEVPNGPKVVVKRINLVTSVDFTRGRSLFEVVHFVDVEEKLLEGVSQVEGCLSIDTKHFILKSLWFRVAIRRKVFRIS